MAEIDYSARHQVLELTFPYDTTNRLQQLAKTIPGYRWVKGRKVWAYPPTIEHAKLLVAAFDPDAGTAFSDWWSRVNRERKAADLANSIVEGNAEATGDFGFIFKTEPRAHQLRYCEWAAMRSLAGLTYRANHSEQGTGKTKCEIDMTTWEMTRELLEGIPLIFCPNSVKRNWVREFFLHAPNGLFHPLMVNGTAQEKIDLIRQAADVYHKSTSIPVPVINYEVLSQPSQIKVFETLMEMAQGGLFGKIIYDESSAVKNPNCKRGKNAFKLAKHIPIRVTMTGTPFGKHITDIFNPMKTLSPEILGASWPAFRKHHTLFGGFQNKQVVGYRNQRELEEVVNRHAFRVLLADCTDLPEEVHTYRYCDMSAGQVKATKKLKKDLIAEMQDEDGKPWALSAVNAMTQLLRFNQISCGHLEDRTTGRTATFSPNPKMKLLISIATDEIDESEKCVIWCCYQYDVVKVVKALTTAKLGCTTYYGADSKDVRDVNEDKFLNDPGCRFMVATAGAGAKGLNWQVANWNIFYSYNFNWEDQEQAAARIRRLTQQKRMTFMWLVAENPYIREQTHGVSTGINQYIIDNLEETSTMAEFMTGDFRKTGADPETFFRRAIEVM